jgi:hypothetical protein
MTIRNAALLAAIGSILQSAYPGNYRALILIYTRMSSQYFSEGLVHLFATILVLFLPALALAFFFSVLYGEASGQIRAETRIVAAALAGVFMGLDAGRSLLSLVKNIVFVFVTIKPPDFIAVPSIRVTIANHLLDFIGSMSWMLFLVGFARRRRAVAPRAIPRLAVVLAIFIACRCLWDWYLLFDAQRHAETYLAPSSWEETLLMNAFGLFVSGTSILFFLTVWKRWKPDLSVDENLVAKDRICVARS